MTERVSVIIPTYNRREQLGDSIQSVLQQTYNYLELIVVDDGSEDDTEEMVRAIKDNRLRYIKLHKNTGAGYARNEGVRQSQCSLIAFQDSDDLWRPERLEHQMRYWQEHPDCDMIYCPYLAHVMKDGKILKEAKVPDWDWGELEGNIFHSLLKQNTIGAPTILMRKDCFLEVGGFDVMLRTLEDWDFALRVSEKYTIGYLDEVLVDAFISEGGVSTSGAGTHFDTKCRMIARYREQMIEDGIFDKALMDLFQDAEKNGVLNEVTKMLLVLMNR